MHYCAKKPFALIGFDLTVPRYLTKGEGESVSMSCHMRGSPYSLVIDREGYGRQFRALCNHLIMTHSSCLQQLIKQIALYVAIIVALPSD